MYNKEIFARNLKEIIKKRNISKNKLAKELNISYRTLNNWLNNNNEIIPNSNNLIKLCKILDIGSTYFEESDIIVLNKKIVNRDKLQDFGLENETLKRINEIFKYNNNYQYDINIYKVALNRLIQKADIKFWSILSAWLITPKDKIYSKKKLKEELIELLTNSLDEIENNISNQDFLDLCEQTIILEKEKSYYFINA